MKEIKGKGNKMGRGKEQQRERPTKERGRIAKAKKKKQIGKKEGEAKGRKKSPRGGRKKGQWQGGKKVNGRIVPRSSLDQKQY